jgi:CheY-like chemotaxis protein
LAFEEQGESPLLSGLLEQLGHECLIVHTGEGVLQLLHSQHPDVVILYFMMADIDGIEVLRRIRARPGMSGLPIIMFSGIGDPAFGKYLISRGASDYWVQGAMDLSRLHAMIAQAIETRASAPNICDQPPHRRC